uniref:Cytochrome P450 n=1 Tax=Kalanchoe fedtschenkoi TaxID=63787 RepID=A0A7N0V1I4_KALFE
MDCSSVTIISPNAIIWALAGLIVWLIARFSLLHRNMQVSYPPGPRPWSIIGNLNLIAYTPTNLSTRFLKRQGGKIFITQHFNSKRLESYKYVRAEERCKEVRIRDHLSHTNLSLMSRIVLGKKYFNESADKWEALDLKGYVKKMKRLSKKFDKLLDFSIKEHKMCRNRQQKERAEDMMDVLLDLVDDPELEVKLTTDNVKAFTLEAFRLHPVTTLLPPHRSLEDCQIGRYHLPKGTILLINLWSIGRDPTLWDSPEEFYPERFLNKDIDIKGQSFEFLGLKLTQSSLANLLHGFNWTLPQEMKLQDLDMEETYGLTTHRKNPLIAVLEPRLSPHLYTTNACPP